MNSTDPLSILFVASAFLFQIILIVHFALRRWRFELAMRYGPVVYALSVSFFAASLALLLGGKSWTFWLGGVLYLAWAAFGYTIEYVHKITGWRSPINWRIFGPYVSLYLATAMFYWWPLMLIAKPLWYGYAVLYIASTILNVMSHQGKASALKVT